MSNLVPVPAIPIARVNAVLLLPSPLAVNAPSFPQTKRSDDMTPILHAHHARARTFPYCLSQAAGQGRYHIRFVT